MSVSDEDGRFEMNPVPSGDWTFQFWHPKLGYVRRVERMGKEELWLRGRVEIRISGEVNELGETVILARTNN